MQYILFDLDGTLIDSKLDLANALNESFEHFGLKKLPNEKIYSFVGNGVRRLIEDSLGFLGKLDMFPYVFNHFLTHYHEHLLDNTKLYEGMDEVLEILKKRNRKMFVVSNKSEIFAKEILKGLGVDHYFEQIVGGDTFPYKKPHPQPVIEILRKYGAKRDLSLMVGDSENDIEAAKAVGLYVGWAAYGFRDETILKKYTVDFVIQRPLDLLDYVL